MHLFLQSLVEVYIRPVVECNDVVFIDRLPLPQLQIHVVFSVLEFVERYHLGWGWGGSSHSVSCTGVAYPHGGYGEFSVQHLAMVFQPPPFQRMPWAPFPIAPLRGSATGHC